MNAVELIRDFLVTCDVKHVFGVPGYANYPIFVAAATAPELKIVLTKHEASAAWMAYGHALSTGGFGVCTGTSGAGSLNLVPGVVASYYNSIPILVLTGQVETTKFGKGAFQELTGTGTRSVSALDVFKPMTKLNLAVHHAAELPGALQRAYEALTTGRRGPVHLSLPIDVQKAGVPGRYELDRTPGAAPQGATAGQLDEVRRRLAAAKAPLLLFGRGCRRDKAAAEAFARQVGAPFCTTMQAKGLVAPEHPLNFGVVGVAGTPRCNQYLADSCDVLLAIGTSLNEFTTGGYAPSFGGGKAIIQVDLDAGELGKNYPLDLAIHGDCRTFFAQALAAWGPAPLARRDDGETRAVLERALDLPMKQPVRRDRDDERIAPMDIMGLLERACPADTVFVADSGNNAVWAVHYLSTKDTQDFQIDINTGCMASGVISAIGTKFAHPHRPVVCVCGDGGFMMAGFEATTAADYDLPVLWIVMNDHKLGMVKQGGIQKYGAAVGVEFKHCDIAATARTLGLESLAVHDASGLEQALGDFFKSPRPLVLDVRFNDRYLPEVYARVRKAADDEAFSLGADAK